MFRRSRTPFLPTPGLSGRPAYFFDFGIRGCYIFHFGEALANIAKSYEIIQEVATSYGTKYIVDGQLPNPNGRPVRVRTIWIVESANDSPRFVTAYPTKN
jgi:hypothetical protein